MLVRCAKEGDDNAFEQLYQRHKLKLCAYITHMTTSYEEAQQLTQETYATAWLKLSDLQADASFKSWLYGIATHKTLDFLRKEQKEQRRQWISWEEYAQQIELCDHLPHTYVAAPDEQVISREITRLALQRVTASYRACMLLQIDAKFSQAEIATFLGISANSVSVFVKRGLRQYQQALEQIENEIKTDLEKGSR